jgi:hypothetical protein
VSIQEPTYGFNLSSEGDEMKVFSWNAGRVTAGVEVRADERLGQIVFLGEEGRGRRYEKVALAKRNPAEVIGGRVLEARVQKITLPATGGKPEKSFFRSRGFSCSS